MSWKKQQSVSRSRSSQHFYQVHTHSNTSSWMQTSTLKDPIINHVFKSFKSSPLFCLVSFCFDSADSFPSPKQSGIQKSSLPPSPPVMSQSYIPGVVPASLHQQTNAQHKMLNQMSHSVCKSQKHIHAILHLDYPSWAEFYFISIDERLTKSFSITTSWGNQPCISMI